MGEATYEKQKFLKRFWLSQTLGDVLFKSKGTIDPGGGLDPVDVSRYLYTYGIFTKFLTTAYTKFDPNYVRSVLSAMRIFNPESSSEAQTSDIYLNFESEWFDRSMDKKLSACFAQYLADETDQENWEIGDDPYDYVDWDAVYLGDSLFARIETSYGNNLDAIWKAYFDTEYAPLENYNMTQEETPDITITDHAETNTNMETSGDSDASVYGFNSATAVPASEGSSSQTTTGDKDDNYTDATHTETGTRTLTRSGNIGVTTSQQMLQAEIELRKFDFMEQIYAYFDKVMVRSVY